MGKYKKYINLVYLVIFIGMVVLAYTTSKYRPESVSVLFTDFSWLGDWPKWLDFPLMPFLNKWFDILIVKYGIMFEGINFFLLGLYGKMKNFLVGLPWPLLMISVILLAYVASGRNTGTTIMVAFCVFFLGFLSPRYWDKCIMTTTIVIIGIDEPENSLHITSCYEQFARLKKVSQNAQVLITTHWYGFLPIVNKGIVHFIDSKEKGHEEFDISFNTVDLYCYQYKTKNKSKEFSLKSTNDVNRHAIVHQ